MPDYSDLGFAPGKHDDLGFVARQTAAPAPKPSFTPTQKLRNLMMTGSTGKSRSPESFSLPPEHPLVRMAEAGKEWASPSAVLAPFRHPIDTAVGMFGATTENIGKTKEDLSSGRYGKAAIHALGSLPVIGPPAAQLIEESTSGKLPEAIGHAGAAFVVGKGMAGAAGRIGQGVKAARGFKDVPGTGVVDRMAVMGTDPIPAMIKAIKPRATAKNFRSSLERAAPEIKRAEAELGRSIGGREGTPGAQPGHAIEDTMRAIKLAKTKLWDHIQNGMGGASVVEFDSTPVAKAAVDSIPKLLWHEDPKLAASIVRDINSAWSGKSLSIPKAEELLQGLNAKLNAKYYSKYPTAQRSILATDPETAGDYAKAEALRGRIYTELERHTGSDAVQQDKRTYGALTDIERQLEPRMNVAIRQNPNSLMEQGGKIFAATKFAKGILTKNPIDIAEGIVASKFAQWVKEANTTDVLLRRSFANYKPTPEPVRPLPVYRLPAPVDTSGPLPKAVADFRSVGAENPRAPRALLGGATPGQKAPIITPPPADTSGPIPNVPPNLRGYPAGVNMRLLPPPSGPVQQPGFAVQDLVPFKHPVTGKIEYVPKWMLQGRE